MSAEGALQSCLAAEHAALYGYGVLGGVLSREGDETEQKYAEASYAAHRTRRDVLTELINGLGEAAGPAEPVYAPPFDVTGAASCRRLARILEHRTAAVYCFAVSQASGDVRRMLAAGLTDAAVREARWGGEVQPFPGASDL